MIPMILAAQKEVAHRAHKLGLSSEQLTLRLLASPWSPPAWMKLPVYGVPGTLRTEARLPAQHIVVIVRPTVRALPHRVHAPGCCA